MGVIKRIQNQMNGTAGLTDPENEQSGIAGTIAASTDLVPVQRLFGNMLVLKDGTFRMIIKTGSVNFELKSTREQSNLVRTYGELLNSLTIDFPIQIFLHASPMDTHHYVTDYQTRFREPTLTSQMRQLIEDHLEHFEAQALQNYLLDRAFYIVIPFFGSGIDGQQAGGVSESLPAGGSLRVLFDSSKNERQKEPSSRDMDLARSQLLQRVGQIMNQLARLQVSAELLDELEIVQLLRDLYNPGAATHTRLRALPDEGLISMAGTNRDRNSRGETL